GKTPLEAAETPQMDVLAKRGRLGLVHTVGEGIAPESDIGVISILGYDAMKYYTGRGPLETFAAGLTVNDGDLAYRVNFATLGPNGEIVDRRVGRNLTQAEADELCREVNAKVKLEGAPATFEFKNTIGHRGVLVIRSLKGKLSSEVGNTDPAYGKEGPLGVALLKYENKVAKCVPVHGHERSRKAKLAAQLTNEFVDKSHQALDACEVNKKRVAAGKLAGNVILTRDGGDRLPKFPSLSKKFGFKFGCFVEMPVERGIAMLTGMEVVPIPAQTGDLEKDYTGQAALTAEKLASYDALYIHIKGPDLPGHDGDAKEKKDIITAIDRFYFAPLLPKLDLSQVVIAITADHSTPCELKAHSADPVPTLISGGGVEADATQAFSEKECARGALGKLKGVDLMPLLVKLARE
ncbi:MAG: 2,3-bisphosphoglycerate-independent phosphoglycerate mutase, partial [Planctomycetes bacterium]|nr:2,3-bisphosphoglycerate-independent phosphoglycerate mutase [Planctomycetota bacterium]